MQGVFVCPGSEATSHFLTSLLERQNSSANISAWGLFPLFEKTQRKGKGTKLRKWFKLEF